MILGLALGLSGALTATDSPTRPVRQRRARPVYELPARNETEISLLPSASLTAGTLPVELDRMARALRAGLDRDDLGDADRILGKFAGNSGALANAAAVSWVERSPGASLLLAVEAVRARPESATALNNLGALLCQAGYLHKGLPVLEYLSKKIPDSPTVLNNLGQAWLEMGEIDKAEVYLNRCLALAPHYAAAHAAAGLIAQARGQAEPANTHFQAAVATDFSPAAAKALDQQDIKHGTPASFTRLIPVAQYFNPHHFVPPRPPQTGEEAIKVDMELADFYRLIYDNSAKLKVQQDAADAAWQASLKTPEDWVRRIKPLSPEIVGMALLAINNSKVELNEVVERTIEKYESDIARLKADRESKFKGVSDCAAGKAINDAYLTACASTYGEMEDKLLPLIRNGTNLQLSYLPLTGAAQSYRSEFARTADTYLGLVMRLARLEVINKYTCGTPKIGVASTFAGEVPPFGDCPFKISVNVFVAKLKADCKSVGFELTAGLEFSAKKDFVSGETSLTAGLATPDLEFGKYGSVRGAANFILVWDRDNNLNFVGVQSGASVEYGNISDVTTPPVRLGDNVTGTASVPVPLPISNLFEAKSDLTIGVSLGPKGTGSTVRGQSAASILGQGLFEAKI